MAGAESGDPDELPIRTTEPMAFQSRQMLMVAKTLGLLAYRYPVDMNEQAQVATLREDLGAAGQTVDLPTDNGVYYLVIVDSDEVPQAAEEARRAIQAALAALPAEPWGEHLVMAGLLNEDEVAEFDETVSSARAELARLAEPSQPLESQSLKRIEDQLRALASSTTAPPADDPILDAASWLSQAQTAVRRGRVPVLIREGEVRGFVMGLAVKAGRETAAKLRYYHGLLPV